MPHQAIVERVNRVVVWAHKLYQLISPYYDGSLYKTPMAGWKAAAPVWLAYAHVYLNLINSG